MDFMFNWAIGIGQIIGMPASQIFYAVHDMKEGDPVGWCEGFEKQARIQLKKANEFIDKKQMVVAAEFSIGAAYAFRAALQYTNPKYPVFFDTVKKMENAFMKGIELLQIPIRPIEVPFEETSLSGYFLEHADKQCPLIVMVGGGDTIREDLFYFAGYPGWKRGYNVVMVDLPGQGIMPSRGLHMRVNMHKPISTILDWVETNALVKPTKIATYGVSGGGYFTTQAVANDTRINAWIAATPIFDIAEIFRREVGKAIKAPGWALNIFMKLTGAFNKSAEINLDKYAWQFGTKDFKTAFTRTINEAEVVDYSKIICPSLFLMSEGESKELKRQTQVVYDNFKERNIDVTLSEFTSEEGADGHCQLNNLRLAHLVIFDWLDNLFSNDSGDIRFRC